MNELQKKCRYMECVSTATNNAVAPNQSPTFFIICLSLNLQVVDLVFCPLEYHI